MKLVKYFGNGYYCWANSTAMLLSSAGENISPSAIEILSGVGLGAFILPGQNIPYFSNFACSPDKGISKALKILNFSFVEKAKQDIKTDPFSELREVLKKSPAVLGPVDMSYLTYNPDRPNHLGVDHYIFIYGIQDEEAFLHDPAGFPHMIFLLNELKESWAAEEIGYRQGYYRFWAEPKRIEKPSEEEIYKRAINSFKDVYQSGEKIGKNENCKIDEEAFLSLAGYAEKGKMRADEIGFLTEFAFPLGAKRSLDFAAFFSGKNNKLASLKNTQSQLFGKCHVLTMAKEWRLLASTLKEFSLVEKEFKNVLLASD